jgi:hypothetical protein
MIEAAGSKPGCRLMSFDGYSPRSIDVAAEDFDGEFVVLDLASGKYFSLAGSSAIAWRGLIAGHSVDSLCARLPAGDPRRAGVEGLVASLVSHGLIVPTQHEQVPPPELAQELAEAPDGFGVDVFDDLADLLVADPIHDVDPEAGWPHLPPKA